MLATIAVDIKEVNHFWAAETHLPWGTQQVIGQLSPGKVCNSQ